MCKMTDKSLDELDLSDDDNDNDDLSILPGQTLEHEYLPYSSKAVSTSYFLLDFVVSSC